MQKRWRHPKKIKIIAETLSLMKTCNVAKRKTLTPFSRDITLVTCSRWTIWPLTLQKMLKKYKVDIQNQ